MSYDSYKFCIWMSTTFWYNANYILFSVAVFVQWNTSMINVYLSVSTDALENIIIYFQCKDLRIVWDILYVFFSQEMSFYKL
jgi:hypothetical protein